MLEGVSDGGGDEGGRGGGCASRCLDFNFVMRESCSIVMGFLQLESLILQMNKIFSKAFKARTVVVCEGSVRRR